MAEMCPKCEVVREVVDYRRDTWHTRCDSCSFGRSHGMARVYAENAAGDHERRKPGHTVRVLFYNEWSSGRVIVESPTLATQLELTFDGEPPY